MGQSRKLLGAQVSREFESLPLRLFFYVYRKTSSLTSRACHILHINQVVVLQPDSRLIKTIQGLKNPHLHIFSGADVGFCFWRSDNEITRNHKRLICSRSSR